MSAKGPNIAVIAVILTQCYYVLLKNAYVLQDTRSDWFLVPGWSRLGSTKSLPDCRGVLADRLTNHRSTTGYCFSGRVESKDRYFSKRLF
jgi:hypothetical protein